MLSSVVTGTSTFTRDLPYGWDTLVENIVDPSHIPINLTVKRAAVLPMLTRTPRGLCTVRTGYAYQLRIMRVVRAGGAEQLAP